MSKNAADVKSPDAECEFHFGPVGTALPASATEVLHEDLESAGYLEDPPDFAQERATADITAWNSDDPIRSLLESTNLEVTIKLQQTSALAIELYWGLGDWTSDGSDGAIWTPRSGSVEKAAVLHLTDGEDVFRIAFGKVGISSVGAMNLTRAQAVSYEVTLKRLASDVYDGKGWRQLFSWVPAGADLGS